MVLSRMVAVNNRMCLLPGHGNHGRKIRASLDGRQQAQACGRFRPQRLLEEVCSRTQCHVTVYTKEVIVYVSTPRDYTLSRVLK